MSAVATRAGEVKVNGRVIGRLEDAPRNGIGHALLGVDAKAKRFRVVLTCHETPMATPWRDRRRDALAIAERMAEPTKVNSIAPARNFMGHRYVHASVTVFGHTFHLSTYPTDVRDGVRQWAVDALFAPGVAMPTFCHGEGDRTVNKQWLQGPALDLVNRTFDASPLVLED